MARRPIPIKVNAKDLARIERLLRAGVQQVRVVLRARQYQRDRSQRGAQPAAQRQVSFEHEWRGTPSIKHLIESLGVPHTEVDLVLANGESVDFTYQVRDGDRISVYPMFESLDITPAPT